MHPCIHLYLFNRNLDFKKFKTLNKTWHNSQTFKLFVLNLTSISVSSQLDNLSGLIRRHTGFKWLKPAKNKFTPSDFTSFSSKFQHVNVTSVSDHCLLFAFKICHIIAGPIMILLFTDFFNLIFGGFLQFSPTPCTAGLRRAQRSVFSTDEEKEKDLTRHAERTAAHWRIVICEHFFVKVTRDKSKAKKFSSKNGWTHQKLISCWRPGFLHSG